MTNAPSKPTTAEIYSVLRERICLLDLAPGARLVEESLANEFGVSRTPIRQVLGRLEYERLVDQRPGSGATVSVVDTKELRDVWAVRLKIAELIDEFIVLPAAPHILHELASVRVELHKIRDSRDLRELGKLYTRYHATVLKVFSNKTLQWIHDVLYHQTARVWLQFLPEMDLDHELDIICDELDETIEAMSESSGRHLAEMRAAHMGMLLDRFNAHLRGPG